MMPEVDQLTPWWSHIAAGVVGGLIGTYFAHLLIKDREGTKEAADFARKRQAFLSVIAPMIEALEGFRPGHSKSPWTILSMRRDELRATARDCRLGLHGEHLALFGKAWDECEHIDEGHMQAHGTKDSRPDYSWPVNHLLGILKRLREAASGRCAK